jgi:hypothetical protein
MIIYFILASISLVQFGEVFLIALYTALIIQNGAMVA